LGKISVLHIITNLALGGAQKNALYTIRSLDPEKYEKHFISAPEGYLYRTIKQEQDIKVCFLNCLKRCISPINDIRAVFYLIRYIKQHNISLVHTHSSKAGILGRWAAKFAKVPVIIHTIHGWSFNDYLSLPVRALYVFLERCTAKITTFLIAVSDNDIKKGLDNKIGTKAQYKLIRYGINISDFEKAAKTQPCNKTPVVAMIACFKPQKNPLDFIKAADIIVKQNKNIRFLCIGDGPLRKKIQAKIEALDLQNNIKLLGWRNDVADLIEQADIIVLTSLWEGLPIALLEAMAGARPVVAYDTDGVKEAVEHEKTGYIVPKKDAWSLAEKIQLLLDNRKLCLNMGRRGYDKILNSQFKAETMIEKIENLYENSLSMMSRNKYGK
jgi:glycosyltransferase involved in cell wall biosynthesis